jgi:hypothetical protein
MPKGKGTYGSKVGRPPKKYQEGGTTGQAEAVMDAAMKGQELKSISLENIPTENAPDRSETYQLGGMIKPPTAPSITPTPQYEKGGKVPKWKTAPKDTKFHVKPPKQTFKGKEAKSVPLPKDVSKQYFKGKEIKPAKGFRAKSGKKGKKK